MIAALRVEGRWPAIVPAVDHRIITTPRKFKTNAKGRHGRVVTRDQKVDHEQKVDQFDLLPSCEPICSPEQL